MLAEPTSVAHGQVYLIFVRRENPEFHDSWMHFLVCMYSTSIGILMYLISVQFFYRFCLICRPKQIRFFNGKWLCLWFLGILCVGLNWFLMVRFLAARTPEIENEMRTTLKSEFHLEIEHVELIAIQFYTKVFTRLGFEIQWNLTTLALILNVGILMTVFCTTTVYCAVETYRVSISRLEQQTDHHDRFNNQIFLALVTQSCIPIIFMFLPITLLIIIPLFNLSPKFLVQLSAISISLYPILDPLAVLLIVSSYRNGLIDCFRPQKISEYFRKTISTVNEDFDMDIL